jgi:hypothetical protein
MPWCAVAVATMFHPSPSTADSPSADGAGRTAPEDFQPNWKPHLTISPATGTIEIDGVLDDAGWRGSAKADNFAEVNPGDAVKPPVESEAWITYDREHLYVALIAFDDPEDIRVSLRERDDIFADDYFGLMLDTYGDLGWGYELFVNPIGVQGDLRMLSDGNEDMSFDVVWYSEGQVTATGYQVELAIPWSSLRFPDREEQAWRLNFWRDQQRDVRRRYAWAAINRDEDCFICNFGSADGVSGIEARNRADVIVSALGFQSGARVDGDPSLDFEYDDPDAKFSANVRYGLTTSSSVEVTLNPDFSQVESDAGQIDVNEPFALFFPERRPFFQEGSDLYSTWIDAIYTRSINDPDAAAKFTGQFGKSSVLFLAGLDDQSPIIVPSEERSWAFLGDQSVTNIVRARQNYGEGSTFGALATNRSFTGDLDGSNTVFGFDGRHRITPQLQIEYQALLSNTQEPTDEEISEDLGDATFDNKQHTFAFDGESFWGNAAYFSLERSGRTWDSDFDYYEYAPGFRTDSGFTSRNDSRRVSLWEGVNFRPNAKALVNWGTGVNVGRIWNHRGKFKDEWINPSAYFNFVKQINVNIDGMVSRERFRDIEFDGIRRLSLNVDTRPSEAVRGGFGVSRGRLIRRTFSSTPVLGDALSSEIYATIQPSSRLVIQPSWNYSRMREQEKDGGETLFDGYILRTRASYQFTRELYARVIVEYNEFSDALDVEPLLTYRVNPFTVFFIGAASDYEYGADEDSDDPSWSSMDRQFFAKFQYLFRM